MDLNDIRNFEVFRDCDVQSNTIVITICDRAREISSPVLPFWPNYRLAHPENCLFLLSNEIFSGSKYPKT